MFGQYLVADWADPRSLNALSEGVRRWEPQIELFLPPRDARLYGLDGTLYAVCLADELLVTCGHRTARVTRGDLLVVPPGARRSSTSKSPPPSCSESASRATRRTISASGSSRSGASGTPGGRIARPWSDRTDPRLRHPSSTLLRRRGSPRPPSLRKNRPGWTFSAISRLAGRRRPGVARPEWASRLAAGLAGGRRAGSGRRHRGRRPGRPPDLADRKPSPTSDALTARQTRAPNTRPAPGGMARESPQAGRPIQCAIGVFDGGSSPAC